MKTTKTRRLVRIGAARVLTRGADLGIVQEDPITYFRML